MANPANISLLDGQWTAVAVNTTQAVVRVKQQLQYWFTYRLAGAASPSDDIGAQRIGNDRHTIIFSHSEPIDCYIKSVGGDGEVLVMS